MNRQRVQEMSEQSKREKWPFPKTFEALKNQGVSLYSFDVITCETVFMGNDGTTLTELLSGADRVDKAPVWDASALVEAIKRHMMGTPFLDFRGEVALAGVQFWEVSMNARTCTYFGVGGGRHVEHVPFIDGRGPSDEQSQRVRLDVDGLRAGATDVDGEKIVLVFSVTDDYVVYITENGVKHDSIHPTAGRFAAIADAVIELNYYRQQFSFIDMAVAQAKVACLEGSAQVAKNLLNNTRRRVLNLLRGAGRLRYILVCMVTSGIVVAAASLLSHFTLPTDHLFMAWMAACGSLGAFLSVSLNLTQLQIDPEAPNIMNTISAVSRIVIGIIGAVFILLVIKGNLILGLLSDLTNPAAILAIAVVAGFSETLVPNALRRVETQTDLQDNKGAV